MRSEAVVKQAIKECLSPHGFRVDDIPRDENRSADLLTTFGEERYLIELKQKDRAPRGSSTIKTSSETGFRYRHRIDPTSYRNTLAGLLRDAANQMNSSAERLGIDPFRVTWFALEPPEDRLHQEQLRATMYGTRIAACGTSARYCHFASWSSFASMPALLDGVVLAGTFGIGLFLNHLSPRYLSMKSSRLVNLFGRGAYDPMLDSEAFLLRPSGAAPTREWVAAQLLEMHGVVLGDLIDLTCFSAEVELTAEELLEMARPQAKK